MEKIKNYLKIKAAALYLGVTPNTLRNWEKANKITVYRNPVNSYRLYRKDDLETVLNNIRAQ